MVWDIVIIAVLLIVAIFLVLLEIFLLPGITIAGIGGIIFALGGIFYAYTLNTMLGHIVLISSVVLFGGVFFWMLRSKSFNRVALKTDIDSKLTSTKELDIKEGDEGITLSRLAPIGKARINNLVVEAKSTGDFIDENQPIVVLKVDSYNVIVALKNN